MKYIITDNKDVIMHISDTIGYQENGNPLIYNDTLAIAKNIVKEVYEVTEVPAEVEAHKYCYTAEKGFYENADYEEPKTPVLNEELLARVEMLEQLELERIMNEEE